MKRDRNVKARAYQRTRVCHWCGKGLTFTEATVDHVVAISKGGSRDDHNTVLACGRCNRDRKNFNSPEELINTR